MPPRKKVAEVILGTQEEHLPLPVEQAQESQGEVLPSLDVNKAGGSIIAVHNSGIGELLDAYKALTTERDTEELTVYAGTIDGNAEMKAFLKLGSSLRSAMDRAHKDAKAPFLVATRHLDTTLKEYKEAVVSLEAPVKAAILAYEDREKAAAAAKQAALEDELARLRAENAALKGKMEEEGVVPLFEERRVVVTVRGRDAFQAAKQLFGDAYDEVKTDANGVNYVLEVVLQRKEIQDA